MRRQIGPSGIIGKLTALGTAMSFVMHSELYILQSEITNVACTLYRMPEEISEEAASHLLLQVEL